MTMNGDELGRKREVKLKGEKVVDYHRIEIRQKNEVVRTWHGSRPG